MTNKERAERAKRAYIASEYDSGDVIVNLYDLVCDLLHFADSQPGDPAEHIVPNTETNGEYVARMGLWHYREEVREEYEYNGCEGHPAGPFDPMGQTVYCDGSCRKGVSASQS
jgi:hypothetical protein